MRSRGSMLLSRASPPALASVLRSIAPLPEAPPRGRPYPSLDPCRVSAPFVINGVQAKDFGQPNAPLILVRPWRGIPRNDPPNPE
eukprot:339881-Alexandrium_andersonii.AAC.1